MTITLDFSHPFYLILGTLTLIFVTVALGLLCAAMVWRITYPFLALVSVFMLRLSLNRRGLGATLDWTAISGDWRFISGGHVCVLISVKDSAFTPAVWYGLFKWMYPIKYQVDSNTPVAG